MGRRFFGRIKSRPEISRRKASRFVSMTVRVASARDARGYLRDGVHNSLGEIHQAVSARVLTNWEQFIKQACVHTEGFVWFIKEWLAGLQHLPVPQSTKALENRRQQADEMTASAEKLLKPPP